ncbi:MAG TPA: hybrid sensor histidine kinase/response regulator [Polyangiaceae bacterium]|jgi:signal transduction histidine kinase|nr:hybrid sensor histidine kinase/response regulator [Polyangiaceae bacterium]
MPKILHIEDDAANRLLVRKLLTPAGFVVVDAVDGMEGIARAVEDPPDLVLVDIAIPGLDGYEVTLRLRSEPKLAQVPIVAITAEGSRDTSIAVGCNGLIEKPIDARTFADTVRSYLGGKSQPSSEHVEDTLRKQSQRIVGHLEDKLRQLSEANQRLLQLDQARKEFYRNISHELSTPMTPIVGYVRLLLDRELGELNPQQFRALSAIDECAQRLRGLIDNLLDVTAIETDRMRFVFKDYDLVRVVTQVLNRWQKEFETRGLRAVIDVAPGPLPGLGDPDRLGRAFEQLLDNAAKFTPRGGTVFVRVGPYSDQQYEIRVSDSGPGVPDEVKTRVFEPFFQADGSVTRSFGGAGVGLAVVRGVAQGHGGSVRLRSPTQDEVEGVPLGGASFSMVFARHARSVQPRTA